MRAIFGGKSALCLAAALVLVACVPVCQAGSGSKADKHAQKIEKKLPSTRPAPFCILSSTTTPSAQAP